MGGVGGGWAGGREGGMEGGVGGGWVGVGGGGGFPDRGWDGQAAMPGPGWGSLVQWAPLIGDD